MAKTAVMIRLNDEEIAALDKAAASQGITRATCVTAMVRLALASPLTKAPMSAENEPGVGPVTVREGSTGNTEPAVERSTYERPTQDQCAHPFRDNQNRCRVCGQAR